MQAAIAGQHHAGADAPQHIRQIQTHRQHDGVLVNPLRPDGPGVDASMPGVQRHRGPAQGADRHRKMQGGEGASTGPATEHDQDQRRRAAGNSTAHRPSNLPPSALWSTGTPMHRRSA